MNTKRKYTDELKQECAKLYEQKYSTDKEEAEQELRKEDEGK